MLSSERLDSTTHIGEKYRREEGSGGEIKNMFIEKKICFRGHVLFEEIVLSLKH